jgi:hypothetical protein
MTTESYHRAKAKQKAKKYLAMREAQQSIQVPNERLERSRAWLDRYKALPRRHFLIPLAEALANYEKDTSNAEKSQICKASERPHEKANER